MLDQEAEIQKIKFVNKIDASSITSVEFQMAELSQGYENDSSGST